MVMDMYYHYTYQYPIGNITLACNERSLIGLWIEGQRFFRDIGNPLEEKETGNVEYAFQNIFNTYFSISIIVPMKNGTLFSQSTSI